MDEAVFLTKYLVQAVLRKFPKKELRPGRWEMYRIDMPVYDDTLDAVYFYVPCSDVEMYDGDFCTVLLMQDEYQVYYVSSHENTELAKESIHRFVIADAYARAYPERQVGLFDMLCLPRGSVYETDDSFIISFLSTAVAKNTPIRFSVSKKDLHWVCSENKTKYAHIELVHPVYGVTYRNKKTRWREHTEDVESEEIAVDFLDSKRAAYASVSPNTYCEFLLQEYAFSRLFPV